MTDRHPVTPTAPTAPATRVWRRLLAAPRLALVGLLRAYRLLLSPWLGNQCRFYPSCSVYGIEALQRHGALAGSALTAARVLRCHPWCEGGCDPVPRQRPTLFRHLLPSATGALPGDDPSASSVSPTLSTSSDLSRSLP